MDIDGYTKSQICARLIRPYVHAVGIRAEDKRLLVFVTFVSKIREWTRYPTMLNVEGLKCIHRASTPFCECAGDRNGRLMRVLLVRRKEGIR